MENQVVVQTTPLNTVSAGTSALILNTESFESVMKFSEMMAAGRSTIPKHLHGNKADCASVVIQAMQWQMNPYAVAQKTHLVNGVLGYEAQLVNAVITSMAPTKDRLNYEWFGDWSKIIGKYKEITSPDKKDDSGQPKKYRVKDWSLADEKGLGVKVWATLKGEDEPRLLELLLSQAGTRNSPLWVDDPRQQLAYLAVKRWSRLYCPDVILGVYSPDELSEIAPEKDITPKAKPADVASNAVQEAAQEAASESGVSDEDRALLIMLLETKASISLKDFRDAWLGLKPEEMNAVGKSERDRIDRLARTPRAPEVIDHE